jgi:dolichyl-phosphate-mannose--protein O-mannosyl transferase
MSDEQKQFRLWVAYFGIVYVAVMYLVLFESRQVTTAATVGSAAALTCAVALYVSIGRRQMVNDIHGWCRRARTCCSRWSR